MAFVSLLPLLSPVPHFDGATCGRRAGSYGSFNSSRGYADVPRITHMPRKPGGELYDGVPNVTPAVLSDTLAYISWECAQPTPPDA